MEYVNGVLYAAGGTGGTKDIWKIDTSSGVGTLLGNTTRLIHNLAAKADGTLFGNGLIWDNEQLLSITTDSGLDTIVGSLSPYVSMRAFAIDGAGNGVGWDSGANWLFDIDLTDASTSSIGLLSGSFKALDYGSDGTLYGWNGSQLLDIDMNSVSSTLLKSFSVSGDAFTVIPEPATLSLLALGGLALLRRRKA